MSQTQATEFMRLSQIAYQNNNYPKARDYFIEIVKLDIKEGKLHFGASPYIALSLIYATLEDWINCEKITEKALELEPQNTMLLNHMGVAICSQSKSRILNGLWYLNEGVKLGDMQNCGGNFTYWYKQIEQ